VHIERLSPIRPSVAKFARDSVLLFVANVLSFIGSLVRGFIVPGLIPVGSYGVFNFLNSLSPVFLLLGGNSSAPMPVFLPRIADENDKKVLERLGLGVVIFSYFAMAVILLLVIGLLFSEIPAWLSCGLIAFWFIFFFQEIGNYLYGIIRAKEKFHVISVGTLVFNTTYLGLALLLTYFYGLKGLVVGFFVSNLLLAAYYLIKENPGMPLFPSWTKVRELVGLGFHQNIITVIFGLIAQSDRYVLMSLGGPIMVGFYAIAFQVGQLTSIALGSMVQVLSSKIYNECAKIGHLDRLEIIYTVGLFLYTLFSLIAATILFFSVAPVINALLPKYNESVPLAKVLVWLPAFQTVSTISTMVIVGTHGIKKLNLYLGFVGVFSLISHYVAWRYFGLLGVCYSALFISFLTCLVLSAMVSSNIRGSMSLLSNFVFISLFIVYGMLTAYGVDFWLAVSHASTLGSVWIVVQKIAIEVPVLGVGFFILFIFKRSVFKTMLDIFRADPAPVSASSA